MNTDRVVDFEKYLQNDLNPALVEIQGLKSDDARIHLQKLLFGNAVDRFDYMIDKTILENCKEDYWINKAYEGKDQQMSEKELIKLLAAGDVQLALTQKLQDRLKAGIVSERHSLKLVTLLNFCTGEDINKLKFAPRVNHNTGSISPNEWKPPPERTAPCGIGGFADWLYSRRNGLIHGDGKNYTKSDIKRLQTEFNFPLKTSFLLSAGSTKTASTFYKQVCGLIKG